MRTIAAHDGWVRWLDVSPDGQTIVFDYLGDLFSFELANKSLQIMENFNIELVVNRRKVKRLAVTHCRKNGS